MTTVKVNGLPCDACGGAVNHTPNCAHGKPSTRPKIVCLCGSTRFYDAFQRANYEETMAGRIVLSVGFYPHSSELAHGQTLGCDDAQKLKLDELHLCKIDLADEVLVLNMIWWRCKTCKVFAPNEPNPRLRCDCEPEFGRGEHAPYVGASTRREIAYAESLGKLVRYLNPSPRSEV